MKPFFGIHYFQLLELKACKICKRILCVGVTGIGTRPVVADYMKQIGQTDRRVLATDEWLRVKNAEGVYALGDCATIEQRKIAEDIAYLFKLADKNGDGTLSVSEFVDTMNNVRVRYPQIDLYMERQHMKGVVGLLNDAIKKEKDLKLDLDHFSEAICKVGLLSPGMRLLNRSVAT